MTSDSSPTETGSYAELLDELAVTARTRDVVERQYRTAKLSGEAKQRYGIESSAYIELYQKYCDGAFRAARIRSFGSLVYKALLAGAALGGALSALNLFAIVADQRNRSIASSWKTLSEFKDESFDGGRKAAIEDLLGHGQILYNVDLTRAPLIRLDASPICRFLGLPYGSLGARIRFGNRRLENENNECIRAELQDAILRGAKISYSNFSNANLAYAKLDPYENTRTQAIESDFSYASLNKSALEKVNFKSSSFKGASLEGANLMGAELVGADLTEARLIGAGLTGADLTGADLTGTDMTGATLSSAKFKKVRLCGTKIDKASLVRALSSPNIESLRHESCTVDDEGKRISTIYDTSSEQAHK